MREKEVPLDEVALQSPLSSQPTNLSAMKWLNDPRRRPLRTQSSFYQKKKRRKKIQIDSPHLSLFYTNPQTHTHTVSQVDPMIYFTLSQSVSYLVSGINVSFLHCHTIAIAMYLYLQPSTMRNKWNQNQNLSQVSSPQNPSFSQYCTCTCTVLLLLLLM